MQAVDDAGTTVTLAAPALRIVSLAPHATELLYAAGAGERVVGVLATSDWPPEVAGKPRVGDSRALDLERIVALAPDLVVTWPFAAPAQVGPLVARGVPVFIANPATIDGIAVDLERLGTLAGTLPTATARAAELRARLARLQARYAGARTVRVFYEIWNAPLYTIGGDHLISQALRVCGGENVFAALTLPAPGVSVEAVLAAQPRGDTCRRGRRRAPGVARRMEALADAPRGRARQSLHRRRESPASRGSAVRRRRRDAVRDAGRGACRLALSAGSPRPPAGARRQEGRKVRVAPSPTATSRWPKSSDSVAPVRMSPAMPVRARPLPSAIA